jgi:photosystem II stability/assembly factor-like uncharacterized protein
MVHVSLLVGTRKGAFIVESPDRTAWSLRGPFCAAWPINHVVADTARGIVYAAGGNAWFGPAVWKSTDHGATWTHSSVGLQSQMGSAPVSAVWSLAVAGDRIYAGVEPAGLFVSDDAGETWQPVDGLNAHATRGQWQPGGGGLILHHILPHPTDPRTLWVGISSAGLFKTTDGGVTWRPVNSGVRCDFLPEGQRYPDLGQCVHGVALAAGIPDRLYQQNHCGMYRSDDAGESWTSIEAGLPSSFGFPVAAHPRDPDTAWLLPLNGDATGRFMPDAKAAVWRTRDGGRSWQDLRHGLPQQHAYFGVLRQALASDTLTPAGVYFGTSGGHLFASADEGDRWLTMAAHLPTITSVETLVRS